MWKPYLKVVADRAQQAVHVLDRFHIMSHFSKAIDEVRAAEARKLAAAGKAPVLKHSRWLLLKRPEHLTDPQEDRLADLVRRNLRTVRAYLLKEHFQLLWGYVSPYWAGQFLDRWCTRTMRSRLDPMKEVARMLRSHRDLILNWFRARGQFSSGRCRGLQRQGQSDYQKGIWVSHLPGAGSRFVSHTWRPAGASTYPQILLTRPIVLVAFAAPVVVAASAWVLAPFRCLAVPASDSSTNRCAPTGIAQFLALWPDVRVDYPLRCAVLDEFDCWYEVCIRAHENRGVVHVVERGLNQVRGQCRVHALFDCSLEFAPTMRALQHLSSAFGVLAPVRATWFSFFHCDLVPTKSVHRVEEAAQSGISLVARID